MKAVALAMIAAALMPIPPIGYGECWDLGTQQARWIMQRDRDREVLPERILVCPTTVYSRFEELFGRGGYRTQEIK